MQSSIQMTTLCIAVFYHFINAVPKSETILRSSANFYFYQDHSSFLSIFASYIVHTYVQYTYMLYILII